MKQQGRTAYVFMSTLELRLQHRYSNIPSRHTSLSPSAFQNLLLWFLFSDQRPLCHNDRNKCLLPHSLPHSLTYSFPNRSTVTVLDDWIVNAFGIQQRFKASVISVKCILRTKNLKEKRGLFWNDINLWDIKTVSHSQQNMRVNG